MANARLGIPLPKFQMPTMQRLPMSDAQEVPVAVLMNYKFK